MQRENEKAIGFYAVDRRPRWKRAIARLFPARHLGEQPEREGFAPSTMLIRTVVTVSWGDRLRMLASGRCEVVTRTHTDVSVGRCVSVSQFNVNPPAFVERR